MKRIILLLAGIWVVGTAAAADLWDELATPTFRHVGREDGLPHDIVMDIAQDPSGYVWFATQGGLVRWDGYRSRVFTHVDGDKGSLPDSSIIRLLVDEAGTLWTASLSGVVARFDPETERFEALPIPGGGNGLPGGMVSDGAGGIWLGGSDGLAHFTQNHWERDIQVTGDVSPAVRCLMRTRDGGLFLCGATKLFRQTEDGGGFRAVETQPGDDPILSLLEDSNGRLWYGSNWGEIGLLDPGAGTRTVLSPRQPKPGWIRELAQAGADEVWGVSVSQGILTANAATGAHTRVISQDFLRSALGADTLYTIMRDRAGLMWVGGLGGVYFRPAGPPLVDTIWPTLDPLHGPWGQDVLGLCVGPDDRAWIGTNEFGLLTTTLANDGKPGFRRVAAGGSGLPAILDCAVRPDGTVYYGQRDGVSRIARGDPDAKAERLDFAGPSGPIAVRSLMATATDLWVGSDSGLYRTDFDGHIQQQWSYRADDPGSLSNNSIETLLQDPDGSLWIGTHRGLDHLDRAGHIERIDPTSDPDSLPSANVTSIILDRRGRLWVGTVGGAGIGVLEHPESGGPRHFRRIGIAEGLPSPNIGTLLEDAQGQIWASSTDGLTVIDPETFATRVLGPPDGVTIRSYWVHSGGRLSDGTLLFGGLKGLTAVHPERLTTWRFKPAVVASAIRIGSRALTHGDPIVLTPEDRSLQVEFAALDYSAPERNRYAYRLLGYDADWVETDAQHRLAAYTNLPPGDYTLLLRGSNRTGEWQDPPTRLPISVLPAWYQTYWARMLGAAGLILILFGIVRARTFQLERNRRALEGEVARRTWELRQSQDELERSNITLAASAETLRRLGEIGRGITASLDTGHICATICRNIGSMLDAESISIWLLDETATSLVLAYGIEDDERLPALAVPLDDPERGVARAARERVEIKIDYPVGWNAPLPGTRAMNTALFGPLLVEDQLLGVLTIQTSRQGAYGERERLIFTSLCAYSATALGNAEAHRNLARANAELARLAAKDPLTGLSNRRHFFETAAEEIARAERYQRHLSVIVADLDRFKRINDTLGHAAGDTALRTAAFCFAQCLRETDLAARFGGEEFIGLLPETDLEGAVQVAERFRELLAQSAITYNDTVFHITASIGVATWRPGDGGIERVIERADLALYGVKRGGRNAVATEAAVQPGD